MANPMGRQRGNVLYVWRIGLSANCQVIGISGYIAYADAIKLSSLEASVMRMMIIWIESANLVESFTYCILAASKHLMDSVDQTSQVESTMFGVKPFYF